MLRSIVTYGATYLGDRDGERIVGVQQVIGKHQVDQRLGVRVETEVLVIVSAECVT